MHYMIYTNFALPYSSFWLENDEVFKGCTFQQSVALNQILYDYTYEVSFERMLNTLELGDYYTGEYGPKKNFTFREFRVCDEHNCNSNGSHVLANYNVLILILFFVKFL